jgi:hypothetical protein
MLGVLLAGMVALPRLPLGREVGPVLWRTPRHQVFGRQPSKVLGGLAGMLTQPFHLLLTKSLLWTAFISFGVVGLSARRRATMPAVFRTERSAEASSGMVSSLHCRRRIALLIRCTA